MNFYIEFTQNKELKVGSLILSSFIRHAPILLYLFEFLLEVKNRRVDGFLILFLAMALLMLISGIHLSSLASPAKPAFNCDNLTIKFRHREILVQLLSVLLGVGYTFAIMTTENNVNEYMYSSVTQKQQQHRVPQRLESHLHQQKDPLHGRKEASAAHLLRTQDRPPGALAHLEHRLAVPDADLPHPAAQRSDDLPELPGQDFPHRLHLESQSGHHQHHALLLPEHPRRPHHQHVPAVFPRPRLQALQSDRLLPVHHLRHLSLPRWLRDFSLEA